LLTDRVLRGLHAHLAGLVAELPASRLAGVLLLFLCLVPGLTLELVKDAHELSPYVWPNSRGSQLPAPAKRQLLQSQQR
jgi:hypothetical protein